MRLDRFLAHAGYGTRKEVKTLLKDGRVTLNGHLIKADNRNINEMTDVIAVDGTKVEYQTYYYFLLNKPQGYVSSTTPEGKYPPVTDLIPEYAFAHLFPVGRLDVDTTGVLLLTNHGTFSHRLISPRYHVDKVYLVTTDFPIDPKLVPLFAEGMVLDGEQLLPADLEIISETQAKVTLHQGKYHQVKRMFAHYGLKVIALDRIAFSFLHYDNLSCGEYRPLTAQEITKLEEIIHLC